MLLNMTYILILPLTSLHVSILMLRTEKVKDRQCKGTFNTLTEFFCSAKKAL